MCSHVMRVIMGRKGKLPFVSNPAGEREQPVPETNGQTVRGGDSTNKAPQLEKTLIDDGQFIDIASASELFGGGEVSKDNRWAKMREDQEPDESTSVTSEDANSSSDGGSSADTGPVPSTPSTAGPVSTFDVEGLDLPKEPPSPTDAMFGLPALPAKFAQFREPQWKAIRKIVKHLAAGVKVVMLDAPTGSGKTLIGEAVPRIMNELTSGRRKTPYICTTKSLQNQILEDFDYGKIIKGRANYPTLLRPELTTEDCNGTWAEGEDSCDWCPNMHQCHYQVAKENAAEASLAILNIAYFLAETGLGKSRFADRDLVVIDEADTLEEQLMSWIEIRVTPHMRRQIGLKTIPKKTVPSDWVRWMTEELEPALTRRLQELKAQQRLFDVDVKQQREIKRVERLRAKVRDATEGGLNISEGWVMTGYEGAKEAENATVVFKPVRITRDLSYPALWMRGHQFLLMSATTISAEQMAEDLGLEKDDWAYVKMDSSFPPENRPIFARNVVSVTAKTKKTAYPKIIDALDQVIDENPGVRILVHTVSYELTRELYNKTKSNRVMTYWQASERDRVLAQFLQRDDSVLLAPSFERGIDLPGEDCQVIVIAKIPYPYLGDKQISSRMYQKGGSVWYAVQTIRSIAQMTGRGMRSKDDWCDTYILDAQFRRLYRENKRLFPKWWTDALAKSGNDAKSRRLRAAAQERREKRALTGNSSNDVL